MLGGGFARASADERALRIATMGVNGLHHITAISGPAQENLDFYAGVLGMRLVKKSVNQDDPGTYHLFYADAEGRPGTDLTFFPWAQMAPPRDGYGRAMEVSLEVPAGSLDYWESRLQKYGAMLQSIETRFADRVLAARSIRTACDSRSSSRRGMPAPRSRRGTTVLFRASGRSAASTARACGNAESSRPPRFSPARSASSGSATKADGHDTDFATRPASSMFARRRSRGPARGASAACIISRGGSTTMRTRIACVQMSRMPARIPRR